MNIKSFNIRIISLFLFLIFTWGLAWPVNKIGLQHMTPLWFTASRLIIGTVTMMALVIALGKFSLPDRRDYPLIAIIGILQISLYIFLANLGLNYLPPGRSSVLAYTTPLWVMPATIFLFNEKAHALRWLGFILGMGGLVLFLSPWEIDWTNGKILFGSAMLLLGSLSWAISMLCVRYMEWNKSPLELMPWQLLIGTLPIVLFAFIQEPHVTISWDTELILSLAYTGILVTGLSYWSGIIINKELPTLVVSIGFLLVPLCSLALSAIFMHEVINAPTLIAIISIILGLICLTL